MPELPDIAVYLECLQSRIVGQPLVGVRLVSPFLLRTVDPPLTAAQSTLRDWIDRLRRETGDGFLEHVTAFRNGMAVHGRYRQPCPDCGAPVQRISYADNETNYCARCQTGGTLLADRALSRLLKDDWPRTLDELEAMRAPLDTRAARRDAPPRRRR